MNNKTAIPEKQTKVAIGTEITSQGYVSFWAESDVAAKFERFGELLQWKNTADKYALFVDARFDFNEVVAYIKSFC